VPEQAKEQEDWLVKTLKEAKGKQYNPIIVFLHHPMFLKTENEADEYFNIPLVTRKKYLDLFKENGIRYVFAGHYHRNSMGKNDDMEMITTGPVGKPLGNGVSGFRAIVVKGNLVQHQYYNLDSIPDKIER
jgi:UDP-2,3-diacylglucosamine pyrophosphatase LpxH